MNNSRDRHARSGHRALQEDGSQRGASKKKAVNIQLCWSFDKREDASQCLIRGTTHREERKRFSEA